MTRAWAWDWSDENLDALLSDIPDLFYQLHVATVYDTAFVAHGHLKDSSSTEEPVRLMYDPVAAGARTELEKALRHYRSTGDATSLLAAARHAFKVIDRPKDIMYLGYCPNVLHPRYEMWGVRDQESVRCQECEYEATMKDHLDNMIVANRGSYLTLDELVGAVYLDGEIVTRARMMNWIRRGEVDMKVRNVPLFVDGRLVVQSVETYRIGDVIDRTHQYEEERAGIPSDQVAALLGVDRDYVPTLVQRGKLTPIRPKAKPLKFRLEDVENILGEFSENA